MQKIGAEAKKDEKLARRTALGDVQNRRQTRGYAAAIGAALKEQIDVHGLAKGRMMDAQWKRATSPSKANAGKIVSIAAEGAKATHVDANIPGQSKPRSKLPRYSLRSAASEVTAKNAPQQHKSLATENVESKAQKMPGATKLPTKVSTFSHKPRTKLQAALNKNSTTDTNSTAAGCSKLSIPLAPRPLKVQPRAAKAKAYSSDLIASAASSGGVRNIDDGDHETLILVSTYVNDIYEHLFRLEVELPVRPQHLSYQVRITPHMRAVLVDWLHEVHTQFRLVAETFYIAVSIIDRYLQVVPDTPRAELQLVGTTALWIAAKYEDIYPPPMSDFIYMTDNSYSQQQFVEMEFKILRNLNFALSRPIALHFLRRFSKAAHVDDEEHAMSKYFLELSAIEYELAHYRPSEIAAASLFLALHLFRCQAEKVVGFNNALWHATLVHYSHYDAKYLRPIARRIAVTVRHAREGALNSVYMKYSGEKFWNTSLRPASYSTLMEALIKDKE